MTENETRSLEHAYHIISKIDSVLKKEIVEKYGILMMTEDNEDLATAIGLLGNILDPEYIQEKEHLVITNDDTRKILSDIYGMAGTKANMEPDRESEKVKILNTVMSAAFMLKNLLAKTNDAQTMLDRINTLTTIMSEGAEQLEDNELKELVDKISIKTEALSESDLKED